MRSKIGLTASAERRAPRQRWRRPILINGNNVNERVAKIEALLPTLATKADIGEIRADFRKTDAEIKAWMIATVISLFLGFAGLFFAMNAVRKEPGAPPAPTIIQIPAYTPDTTRGLSQQATPPVPVPVRDSR